MKTSRRRLLRSSARFLASAAGSAIAILTGQFLLARRSTHPFYPVAERTDAARRDATLVRPPGALAERSFLASCIRCYRCQDVCDTGAIRFFTEERGRYFHTPYVDASKAACNLCMECTQVCPTGALQPMRQRDRAAVRMASVELNEDLCLSYKAKQARYQQRLLLELGRDPTEARVADERRGICGECYMVCPLRERAIRYEPGAFLAPIIDTDHCVGCGLCEEICRVVLRGSPAIRVVPTRYAI